MEATRTVFRPDITSTIVGWAHVNAVDAQQETEVRMVYSVSVTGPMSITMTWITQGKRLR